MKRKLKEYHILKDGKLFTDNGVNTYIGFSCVRDEIIDLKRFYPNSVFSHVEVFEKD